jgi:hypothetical protein
MLHAFVSDGRLYVRTADGELRQIESHFAEEKRDRRERQKTSNGWKDDTSSMAFSSAMVWGRLAGSSSGAPYRFTDVVPAGEGSLYYTINNGMVTGLFRYDLDDDFETRLFHKNEITIAGFDFSPGRKQIVAAIQDTDVRTHLELLDERGSHIRGLTVGDVIDSNPSFSYTNPDHIVFQSGEIVRNDEGFIVFTGPSAIMCFDIGAEKVTEMFSDSEYDLMLPRQDKDGNLYCIRRPHKKPYSASLWRDLVWIVTFPFHFVMAIMGFLNAFTQLFARPLMKAQGPQMEAPERQKYVRVLGETIHVAKLCRAGYYRQDVSMVPKSWELIKMDKDKKVTVLAKNISSYDIDAGGNVCCTNGFKVNDLSQDGARGIFQHNLIERIRTQGQPAA